MLPEVFTASYLRKLEMLTLNSRRAFLGQRQGSHISLKRGQGIEFFDYRKYELGDNPRHIDWGLYGRSEKIYVKRFREEQALSVLMLVDSSPSMVVKPEGEISKWELARDVALSISYIALMKQDTIYMAVTSGGGIPRMSGMSGIHRAATFLQNAPHQQPKSIVNEVLRAAARIRFPGVALFYSDLLFPFEELEQSVNILRAKNLDLTVVRIGSLLESDPFQGIDNALAIDSETGEQLEMNVHTSVLQTYQERLRNHMSLVRKFLATRGVRMIEVFTDNPVSDVIVRDMVKAGVVR